MNVTNGLYHVECVAEAVLATRGNQRGLTHVGWLKNEHTKYLDMRKLGTYT